MELSMYTKNSHRRNLWKICILASTISDMILSINYCWLNRAPDGSAFNVIRLIPLKKIVNITLLEPIVAFFLESLHFGSLRTYDQTDIGREIKTCPLSQSKKWLAWRWRIFGRSIVIAFESAFESLRANVVPTFGRISVAQAPVRGFLWLYASTNRSVAQSFL
jgi:hypothetical protein